MFTELSIVGADALATVAQVSSVLILTKQSHVYELLFLKHLENG